MFVLKDFVRRVSPSVFNSYCEGKGLDFRAQESDNADALAEAFAAFISATPQGSLQQLVQTELDFQDVDQLVGGKGSHLLIQKAKSLKLQIDENALGDMSSADKAMWFFLNYEEMFRDVLLEYEVEETVGWQTFCVKKMDLNVMLTFQDVVGKAVSEYYVKTEMRGAVCQAEAFEKFGCVFFIAYPQDYYESEPSYVQGKLDKRQPIQTAFKVFFMYNPELGRLSVKVRGGGLKKFDLASAFSVAVFGSKITEEDTIYYNLNVLKDFSFPFLVPPNDHVEAVKVMSLTIAYPRTEKKRLILSSHNSTGQGLLDMKLWIGELGLDRYLSTMDFVQAKIRVKFSSSVLKIPKAKGTVTVTVSKDSCPLGVVKELDRKVAGYLKDWGIDVSAYSNHAE